MGVTTASVNVVGGIKKTNTEALKWNLQAKSSREEKTRRKNEGPLAFYYVQSKLRICKLHGDLKRPLGLH